MTKASKGNWYQKRIKPRLEELEKGYKENIEPWLVILGYSYQEKSEPWLKGFWYLRIPAVVAVLSVISFGCVPQTIEVYRVLALNAAEPKPSFADLQAVFSFVFILALSFSIWYSANILIERYHSDDKSSEDKLKEITLKEITLNKILQERIKKYKSDGKQDKLNQILQKRIEKYQKYQKYAASPEDQPESKLKVLSTILMWLPIVFSMLGLVQAIISLDNLNIWKLWIGSIFIGSLLIFCLFLMMKFVIPKFEEPKISNFMWFASIPFLMFWLFTFILIIPENPIKPILITVIGLLTLFDILLFFFPGWIKNVKILGLLIVVVVAVVIIVPHYLSKPELIISGLGSINIISISFSGFVIFSSLLSYVGYKYKFPILAILLILLTGFSWLDLNDNHRIRQVENPSYPQLMTLEKSFSEWKEARKDDIEKFRKAGKRYPIYIVSAQGGGIFAAYHAASTLSRLQDLYPAFASHVFAISGVSGGSLGTAAFSSLIKTECPSLSQKPCSLLDKPLEQKDQKRGTLEQKAHELLDQDFLSPLLAAGLFPDSLQGFLFFPINSLDRARGLEYAFEKAWDSAYPPVSKEQKPNLLKGSYYDHWNPKKSAPALVLNTTVVETGDRLVLSPFKIDLPNLKDISSVACNLTKEDIIDPPLSTAAVLSARFISVTPVGWFNRCDKDVKGQKSRLADGGYFENSGVSTAVEIGSRLEEFLRKEKEQEKIKVVYLAITDLRPQKIDRGFIEFFGGLNEIMSPINALSNSRDARGFSIIDQAEYLTDPASNDPTFKPKSYFERFYSSQRFRQFYLHNPKIESKYAKELPPDKKLSSIWKPDDRQFPLGWLLSEPSQEAIKKLVGGSQDCGNDVTETSNNDCVFKSIKEEININPESKGST